MGVGKLIGHLAPGEDAVVIGVGGLGHIGLQLLKVLTGSQVTAIDIDTDKLTLASELGADAVIDGRGDAAAEVQQLTGGGARAVIDFVGSSATLAAAVGMLGPAGLLVIAGLKGGTLPVSFLGVPFETTIATSLWGRGASSPSSSPWRGKGGSAR